MAMNARSAGSVHHGSGAWLIQRLTSLYITGFALFILIRLSVAPIHAYADWVAWWRSPILAVLAALFWASVLVHAWLGMQSVWMDYVRPVGLRLTMHALTGFGLLLLAFWAAHILW
jgi:succinate dehydrogenase / fumarate reductase membrane anchor subunit